MGNLVCTIELHKKNGITIKVEGEEITQTLVMDGKSITTTCKGSETSVITQKPDSIAIECKTFTLDAETITCKSTKDTLLESQAKTDITSQKDMTLESGAKMNATSSQAMSLEGDKIDMKGSNGVTAKGMKVEFKGDTDAKLEAGTSATIKGGTGVEIKGLKIDIKADTMANIKGLKAELKADATVDVEGSAMTTVKGGITKLG